MEGSEKSTGRFALGVGVARVSGGLPKRYLKVAEVFGRERFWSYDWKVPEAFFAVLSWVQESYR